MGGKRKGDWVNDVAERNANPPKDDELVSGPKSAGTEPAFTDGPDRVDAALLDLDAGPHHQCRRVATLVAADTLLRHQNGMLLDSLDEPRLHIHAGQQRAIRVGEYRP